MGEALPDRPPWGEFSHDPRRPEAGALRASDRDRDVVHGVLADGYAEGRLTRDEYDERVERTVAAKLLGELPPLIADLVPTAEQAKPPDLHAVAVSHWQRDRRQALFGVLLGPSLICWVIWAWVAFGPHGFEPTFPWPLFVSLPGLLRAAQLTAGRDDEIARRQARLEHQQRKQLGRPDPGSDAND